MAQNPFSNSLKGTRDRGSPQLQDGARVAVMGGGPAGSFFSYFLLVLAEQVGLHLQVDLYEPRDYSQPGPPGCNMCAGIVSESLIQMLSMEGINLPPEIIQRGMDTYVLHTDNGEARLATPGMEKRIGTVYRGAGPLGIQDSQWGSFDRFLLKHAAHKGARVIRKRIDDVNREGDRVQIRPRGELPVSYDLLAVATGVNSHALKLFQTTGNGYRPPRLAQAYLRDYFLGQEQIEQHLGQHAIHFFLLDLPGLDFAAIVPKGDYVSMCLLGKGLNKNTLATFLDSAVVKACMPPGWQADRFDCQCAPRLNVGGAIHPFAERMVFLGDIGVTRLYKDGIGAAYRTAKYAAATAIFHGVGESDFHRHFWRACQRMENDNKIGELIFSVVRQIKPRRFASQALLHMVNTEQTQSPAKRYMSQIVWDTFTGSAHYRTIFQRSLAPAFWGRFVWYLSSAWLGRPA